MGALKDAEIAQQKASDDTASALSAQKDSLAVLALAKADATAFKPTLRKAKEAADEAQAEFELFHDNCRVACFDSLKMKVSVEPMKVSVEPTPSHVEIAKGEDLPSATVTDLTIGGC